MTSTHMKCAARAALRGTARGWLALAVAFAATGCDLDLENPNAPPESEVVSSVDGMFALAVGMQGQYATSMDDYLVTNSLATDEWGTQTKALISYQSIFTGDNFDNSYLIVEAPWANSYGTIKSANTILANVDQLGLGTGLHNQFTALAKLFKAMSFGMLIQQYESVPVVAGTSGASLQPREVVLDTILDLLHGASDDMAQVTDADISLTRNRLLGTGFDIRNTVNAMLARYSLIAGKYDEAIDAASSVNLAVLSVFSFPPPTRNPVENLAFQAGYVGVLKSFVDEAESGDQRPAYWADVAAAPLP
ncbi:MAG TPA: RagB/SusD family nutrient uptake outer membrane protein, partial [Gemmatimonadaceae bacterium]